MAISIVETVGSASANSFVSAAEFASYAESRIDSSAYDDATTDAQNRALAEATRDLSARNWQGRRTDNTQALSWPREWVTNPDDANYDYYDSNVIPQRVKDATCELALQYLRAGTSDISELDATIGVKREKVGPLETEYFDPDDRARGIARFPSVTRFIARLLAGNGVSARTVRT